MTRVQVRENEGDSLRVFTSQCAAKLLRIGATETAEPIAIGELTLNALENGLCFG